MLWQGEPSSLYAVSHFHTISSVSDPYKVNTIVCPLIGDLDFAHRETSASAAKGTGGADSGAGTYHMYIEASRLKLECGTALERETLESGYAVNWAGVRLFSA